MNAHRVRIAKRCPDCYEALCLCPSSVKRGKPHFLHLKKLSHVCPLEPLSLARAHLDRFIADAYRANRSRGWDPAFP